MSRPRRIHDLRASSRRSPLDPATAVAMAPASPGGSRMTKSDPALRASAASRPRRSAIRPGRSLFASRPPGRSSSRRSTDRPASRLPAMARPSSSVSGVMTTSHSSWTPRATASTGSKVRARSSQATTPPAPWASATRRIASVVRPLEPSPRIATLAERGRPPGPRIASRLANPVGMTRSRSGASTGIGRAAASSSSAASGAGAAASASDPTTCGAAAPHRAWRLVKAAVTSGERVAIGWS